MTKITLRHSQAWKRDDEAIAKLARRAIQREVIVTSDPEVVSSAFYMLLGMIDITPPASKKIGALIGDYQRVIPGQAMNGYPIFTSCEFLHIDDVVKYDNTLERMLEAIGVREAAHDKD